MTLKSIRSTAFVASVATVLLAASVHAQKTTNMGTGDGGSVHVKTEWVIAPAHIAITYGRPTLKSRSEAEMMPAGLPWRTGADVATIITTDQTLKFGDVTLAPGSYSINTEPGDDGWKFIAGKLDTPNQWGVPYQPILEIGRAPMKLGKALKPVEMLTISIDPTTKGGTLRVEWGTKSATIPFTVLP